MSDTPIDLRTLLAILRRQVRLIGLTCAACLCLGLLYAFATTPTYTASALIYVDPAPKDLLNAEASGLGPTRPDDARLESEVGILKSDSIALATLEALDLMDDPEFEPRLGWLDRARLLLRLDTGAETGGPGMLNDALERFRDRTDASRRGLTYLIEVTGRSTRPEAAARLANGLAETYIRAQVDGKVAAALSAGSLLENQIAAARTRLTDSEDALDAFIGTHIDRIEATGGTDIATLRREADRAATEVAVLRKALSRAEQALAGEDLVTLAGALEDDALENLARNRAALLRRLEGPGSDARTLAELQTALDAVDAQLSSGVEAGIGSLRIKLQGLQSDESAARQALREQALGADLPSGLVADLYRYQQEAEIAQRQYASLLSRSRDLQTQALIQVADSRIVSRALAPLSPSWPDIPLILAIAALAGIGLGVGAGLLNELSFGGVTSAGQLADLLPAPVAASVPRQPAGRDLQSVADLVIDAPLSPYAEAFRHLRASIDQTVPPSDGAGRVILVTSSVPSEGKTTAALALARTYDLAGRKTLLIDADFRRPLVHGYLGLVPEHGFADFLRAAEHEERVSAQAFYRADPRSAVGVILGKDRSDQPTDRLFQSRGFAEIVEKARAEFDIVVIDSAPVLPVVDPRFIVPFADAVLMVVGYDQAARQDLRDGYARIAGAAGDRPILTLLNGDAAPQRAYGTRGDYAQAY